MTVRRFASLISAVCLAWSVAAVASAQTAGAQPAPAGRAAGEGRQGGRAGGDPFAGQPRIKALIVSGGCCHDYSGEAKVMMDAISKALPVDWTVAVQGGRGTVGRMSLYDNPTWSAGSTSSSTTNALPTSPIRRICGRSPGAIAAERRRW